MKQPLPTSAERLRQAHVALLDDLRKLEAATSAARPEDRAQLLARLDATRSDVMEHFRFEEQNGYMDAVRKRQPRLERTVQELAMEHRALAQALNDLIAQAGSTSGSDDRIRKGIGEWIARVRDHETRENELVQDAFNLDIAAED